MRRWGYTRLTERLLRVSDLDLEKALDIYRASEASKEQLQKIEGVPCPEQSVDAVRIPHKPPEPVARGGNARQPHAMQCSRCGWNHGTRRCPAKGKTCHKCKGFDHFASVCRTKFSKPVRVQAVELTGEEADPEPSQESPSYRASSSMTNQEGDTHPLFIAALEGSGDSWRVPITTNGSIVTYKVDTGAQVNYSHDTSTGSYSTNLP